MKYLVNQRAHFIGAGLIGTSMALAAKEVGYQVSIEDLNPPHQALAEDLLGESFALSGEDEAHPHFIFVTVPPKETGSVVRRALLQYPNSIVVDVSSVKTEVIAEVQGLSDDVARFIPSHPIAGREIGGPASAQADLFKGRAWIITPLRENADESIDLLFDFLTSLGATVYQMSHHHHDFLFARISHLPQIVSSLLAATLNEVGSDVALSGQGLKDVTRLADSESQLWAEIIALNAEEILAAVRNFGSQLSELENAIRKLDKEAISKVLDSGRKGRSLFAGKHGGTPRDYELFRIVIEDRPGVLGELFALCGSHGINVEDLDIEHSPNQDTGLITLAVSSGNREKLGDALSQGGWSFHIDSTGKRRS